MKEDLDVEQVEILLKQHNIRYPFIIKPDIGERGFHVALLTSREELEGYLANQKENHIIQEYINYPIELGVFYIRMPDERLPLLSKRKC